MFLLVDKDTDKHHSEQKTQFRRETASLKLLPQQPRLVEMKKGSNGYGFYLRAGSEQQGKALEGPRTWRRNQLALHPNPAPAVFKPSIPDPQEKQKSRKEMGSVCPAHGGLNLGPLKCDKAK